MESLGKMYLICTVLVLCTMYEALGAVDYCKLCDGSGNHTMCQYKEGPSPQCNGDSFPALSDQQIQELLHVHNTWRDYVAAGKEKRSQGGVMPSSANMAALTWNEEIAKIAQRWAYQCTSGHDQCRELPETSVGQNVASAGSTSAQPPNVTALAITWYEEVKQYSVSQLDRYVFSMDTGHFTQWVWGDTRKLGCGYVGYRQGDFSTHYLVCNYAPAGNINGRPLYKRGATCSACPTGTTCGGDGRYPHLCAKSHGSTILTKGNLDSGARLTLGCLLASASLAFPHPLL